MLFQSPLVFFCDLSHDGRGGGSFHLLVLLITILQTYGSGNLKRVGVILQRGVWILLLACFPCWAVLINTQPILLAVRQSAEVAR